MKNFESIIILKSDLSKERIKEIINKIKELTNENITKIEEIGLKKLAYNVQGYDEGYYINLEFKSTHSNNENIENYYRQNTDILKYMFLLKEEK